MEEKFDVELHSYTVLIPDDDGVMRIGFPVQYVPAFPVISKFDGEMFTVKATGIGEALHPLEFPTVR